MGQSVNERGDDLGDVDEGEAELTEANERST